MILFSSSFSLVVGATTVPLGTEEYNGHYYKYYDKQMSWEDAKAYCEQLGGHLATITNTFENEFVTTLFSCESVWLGATDLQSEGDYCWVSGENFSYSNWGDGEPNNGGSNANQDYLHLYKTGKWDDIQNTELGFICEWDDGYIKTTIEIPSDAIVYNNHYYKLYTLGYDWDSAEFFCEKMGGHLATIANAEENSFVNGLSQGQNIWLGGTDIANEGVFKWVSGEAFVYANWSQGEPNDGKPAPQDYVQMYADGSWDDVRSQETKMFVCEWDYCCISSQGYSKAHTWQDWETDKNATCFEDGEKSRVCSLCGFKEKEAVEQLTHQYSPLQVVSGSKLIPPIVKEKTCSLCGDVQQIKDWSFVWVPIVCSVVAIFAVFGVVNYVRILKKEKTK